MDTDWCIVCDTRISPELRYLSEITNDDNTNRTRIEGVENYAMQPSSWAYCSTNCFTIACDEARSKNISGIRQTSTKIHTKMPKSNQSYSTFSLKPLQHPRHQVSPKLLFDGDSSINSNLKSKSSPQNFISPFTFGSYGSSSMSSSNSSSGPATRC